MVALWNYQHFPKSFSLGNKNLFGQKNYGEVVLNWRTNDQIMPRFGRSFIFDKCIFDNLHLKIKPCDQTIKL